MTGGLVGEVANHAGALVQSAGALAERDPIVVAGCEENMGELVPQFDFVVLLVAPLEVMRARVLERSDPWGNVPSGKGGGL